VCIEPGSVDDVGRGDGVPGRRRLSEDGIVLPIIAIDRQTGRQRLPEIVSRGFGWWPKRGKDR